MKISVQRFHGGRDHSGGVFYIDGQPVGFTLEDEKRNVKVWGETRIPAGVYKVTLQKAGKLHDQYKVKFAFHKGMLLINNVPGFQGIMIHIGNTEKDTAGCLLVGLNYHFCCNKITDSTKFYEKYYPLIAGAIEKDGSVDIHVIDELVYS